MSQSLCIVTPDLIGPIKNGGIGTHAFNLALDMVQKGFSVTILFTGPIEFGSHRGWVKFYVERGIVFESIDNLPNLPFPLHAAWFVERSYKIYLFLQNRKFDTINFQEWQANGFHTLQAKKSTQLFQDTKITVTTHSSTEWIARGSRDWSKSPLSDAKLQWCERYCCENCDILISPSAYMLDWLTQHDWPLPQQRVVAPLCYEVKDQASFYTPENGKIAFFGRLETRKGLAVFVEAINLLDDHHKEKIKSIAFVGKIGEVQHQRADEFIRDQLSYLGDKVQLFTDLSSHDAIEHLKGSKAAAFIPSLVDNLPYTVIECCMNGIPVLASNVGGIPEILDETNLFVPEKKHLSSAICRVLQGDFPATTHQFKPRDNAEKWSKILRREAGNDRFATIAKEVHKNPPLVTICTPYYNHGKYIANLIRSVQSGSYQNWELIIVDDGSTDANSIAQLDKLKAENTDPRVKFDRKKNEGVGATRNRAASLGSGEYLVFLDSDNYTTEAMLTDLVIGIRAADCDLMTCHFKAFPSDDETPDIRKIPLYGYAPIGPALEVGWAENVFGDANFIIKRSVFQSIGGFTTERHTSWEDWDILARLSLAGFKQDVIPLMLLWYRHTAEGFSRNTNEYLNHQRVLRAYTDNVPPYMGRMFREVLAPYRFRLQDIERSVNAPSKLKQALINFWDRLPTPLQKIIDPIASFIDRAVK